MLVQAEIGQLELDERGDLHGRNNICSVFRRPTLF